MNLSYNYSNHYMTDSFYAISFNLLNQLKCFQASLSEEQKMIQHLYYRHILAK